MLQGINPELLNLTPNHDSLLRPRRGLPPITASFFILRHRHLHVEFKGNPAHPVDTLVSSVASYFASSPW
jgi:hypothetical protein